MFDHRRYIAVLTIGLSAFYPCVGGFAQTTDDNAEAVSTVVTPDLGQVGEQTVNRTTDAIGRRVGAWGNQPVLGIEVWRFLALFLLLAATFVTTKLVRWLFETYAIRLAQKTSWQVDDLVFERAGQPASLFVTSLGTYLAVMMVLTGDVPQVIGIYFGRVCFTVAAGAVVWYCYRLVDVFDHYLRKIAGRTDNDLDDAIVDVLRKTLRIFVVVIGFLFIGKSVLQWDITAILASAGIFGLAIAFAAQDTIANFFGTLMLLLDRPFKVGERVKVEGSDGAVESIGFRSTRIRTLDGHQVSLPNKSVANAMIENVGRRPHIKRVTTIGITYDTPVAKVQKALEMIREVLRDHEGMDPEFPPRVHFTEFADCSLNILVIAWYHPADYWNYLAWCETVNLEIMRQFETEGIEFAFPTTTTYLAHDPARPLTIKTVS